jgi:hypothetical protein
VRLKDEVQSVSRVLYLREKALQYTGAGYDTERVHRA